MTVTQTRVIVCQRLGQLQGLIAMGKADPMVNVRMHTTQLDDVDTAAARDDLSRSTWCREVITAVCGSGLTLEQIVDVLDNHTATQPALLYATHAKPRRLGARRKLTGKCLHPVHQVHHYPTRDVCACGQILTRHDRRR